MKCTVCLELGGTNLRYGIVEEDLTLRSFQKIPTRSLAEASDKVDYLARLLEPVINTAGRERVQGVSLALSSLMDRERTTVYSSPMVEGFNNIPLKPLLSERLGLPVIMEKDVNILLLYEIGKLQTSPMGIAIGVFLGTGLGNAMCIGGRIYSGHTGSACELGHIPVPGLEEMCGCGKQGCIELLACGSVLAKIASRYNCHVSELFKLHLNKPDVLKVVELFGIAMATEICLLDPEHVILGGGVAEMESFPHDYLLNCVKENLRMPNPRESLRIIPASGDEAAGVIGAAIHFSQQCATAC